MTVAGPPDDYTDQLKEAAHEVLSMTDIVERLRACQGVLTHDPECNCAEAADEIERLREQLAALQASSGYEASIAQVEIERLRAALAEIAAHDDQFSTPQQAHAMRDAARRALEPKP